jgi:hypothetical protein
MRLLVDRGDSIEDSTCNSTPKAANRTAPDRDIG